MSRKRLTQLFPCLLPLRRKQRLLFFYWGMSMDKNQYANEITGVALPHLLFTSGCPLYNRETGFDMVYQQNKVFNLKLAAKVLNGLVIKPHETFSFWQIVRNADKTTPYKEGLLVSDGVLTTSYGGGMCQMSNLLFWLFLHTPLTIIERHGHGIKDFPDPPSDAPLGVDATILEGWIDLKVRNDTDSSFQIIIAFDDESIIGSIFTNEPVKVSYTVSNDNLSYRREKGKIIETVDVVQYSISAKTGQKLSSKVAYRNVCEIGYNLPDTVKVIDKTN